MTHSWSQAHFAFRMKRYTATPFSHNFYMAHIMVYAVTASLLMLALATLLEVLQPPLLLLSR